jgi:hypothetical protein
MEVDMKTTKFYGIGGALAVAALLFVAIGCSSSSPTAPNATLDGNTAQTVTKDGPRAQSSDFELSGRVLAYYPDKSMMVFSGESASDRSATPGKYDLVISKNAVVVLLSSRQSVPFDAKYAQTGTTMTVFGSFERDGSMIVNRIELWQVEASVATNSSSN